MDNRYILLTTLAIGDDNWYLKLLVIEKIQIYKTSGKIFQRYILADAEVIFTLFLEFFFTIEKKY